MDALAATERELASHLVFLSRAIEATGVQKKLTYTEEEEHAVKDRLNDATNAFRKALQGADEWLLEVAEPAALATGKTQLARHQELMKTHSAGVRKVLLAYSQKAKVERSQQARASLLHKSGSSTASKSKSGSAIDTTASLKRSQNVMTEEVARIEGAGDLLNEGRATLKKSHQEFDKVNAEIAEVRQRLKALKWQAQQDRMWIAAGIALLAATVLYIMHQRTGLLII